VAEPPVEEDLGDCLFGCDPCALTGVGFGGYEGGVFSDGY